MLEVFENHFLDLAVSIVLLVLSGFVALMTGLLKKNCNIRCNGIYLVFVMLCATFWIFAKSQGFLFAYNNYVLSYYIQHIALFSMPVFLYWYLAVEFESKFKKQYICLSAFHLAVFLVLICGQFTGIKNFVEVLTLFSVIFFVTSLISTVLMVLDMKERNKQKHLLAIYIMLFALVFSIIADVLFSGSALERSTIDFFFYGSICAEFVGMIAICFRVTQLIKEEYEAQKLKVQLDSQINHYSVLEERDSDIRSYRHDMKNHWKVVEHLLTEGEADMAKVYANTMLDALDKDKTRAMDTGNPILDAILTEKIRLLQERGVKVSTEILIVKNIRLDYLDWCSIFGNILDNVLEALAASEGEKWLGIKMISKSNMLICKFVNNINPNTAIDKQFRTTKADKELHGFGLRNIKRSIEKYDGSMDIQYDDKNFSISFILYDVS